MEKLITWEIINIKCQLITKYINKLYILRWTKDMLAFKLFHLSSYYWFILVYKKMEGYNNSSEQLKFNNFF